jgi:adenosylhomocysteine nucleosidase
VKGDPTRPVAIVVAMGSELRHLLEACAIEREERDGIWLDRWLSVGDLPVVAVRCGIGLINAAASTERLINAHRPSAILNFGCAGSHQREIMPGDVIIGNRIVHHSSVFILPSGEEHYTGFGYEFAGEKVESAELVCDPQMVEIARSVADGWHPEPWPTALVWPDSVPYRQPRIHVGTIASADIWTQSSARLDILHGRHGSLCEEMEAAGIGQVCALHEVPFLAIKDVSNNEYHRVTDLLGGSGDSPEAEVGKRAAALTLRVLAAIAGDYSS